MRHVLADIDARKTAAKRGQPVARDGPELARPLMEDASE
jgi:hypothetical protein